VSPRIPWWYAMNAATKYAVASGKRARVWRDPEFGDWVWEPIRRV
jgi:hypothetical protein